MSYLLSIAIGMSAGHFIYQAAFGAQDWLVATERSFFACATLGAVALIGWMTQEPK